MQTSFSQLKLYISTLLLAFGLMAAASQAFAVSGGDLGLTDIPANTEITIFGPGLKEDITGTTDENGKFDIAIPCIPGKTYQAKYVDERGKERMIGSFICPQGEAAASGSEIVWVGVAIAAAGGLAAVLVESPVIRGDGGTTPTTALYPHTGTATGNCGYDFGYSVTCIPATGIATSCIWSFPGTLDSGGVTTTCSGGGGTGSCFGPGFHPPASVTVPIPPHFGSGNINNGQNPAGGSSWIYSAAGGSCTQTLN